MSPLEAMAKARWEHINIPYGGFWDHLTPREKAEEYEAARVCLLSLAEVELSEEAISQGDAAYYAVAQKKDGDRFSALRDRFRAMLRSIAEGS